MWGFATAAAGLAIALMSPVLGAIADASGRRKPWIAGFGALLVLGSSLMWIGRPGDASMHPAASVRLCAGLCRRGIRHRLQQCDDAHLGAAEPDRAAVRNGLGHRLCRRRAQPVLVLGFLAASPDSGRTLFGFKPLFGLDPATHAGDRITGPIDGAVVHPVRDAAVSVHTGLSGEAAGAAGAARGSARTEANDRRIAKAEIGGDVPARQHDLMPMGWCRCSPSAASTPPGPLAGARSRSGTFGIILAIAGVFGAWFSGKLDDLLGPKRVIVGSLIILLFSIAAILFGRQGFDPVRAGCAARAGRCAVRWRGRARLSRAWLSDRRHRRAVAGGSRTLLIQLAPRDRIAQYFGLFALTGKVTSFMGPLLIGAITAATASQKAGMAVLVLFFLGGLALILRVRD